MRASIVGVAVAAAACFLLVVLLGSEPRRSGTNNVAASAEAVELAPRERSCQPESVPGASERVAIAVAAPPGAAAVPRLTVAVERGGRAVASGRPAGRLDDGRVDVPLAPAPPAGAAELCVRNDGRRPLALLGQPGAIAVDYYRGGSETWLQAAPAVARHFGLGKSGLLGPWALWLALAAVAAAWLGAWRALREQPR
jgi:hypothetical protein